MLSSLESRFAGEAPPPASPAPLAATGHPGAANGHPPAAEGWLEGPGEVPPEVIADVSAHTPLDIKLWIKQLGGLVVQSPANWYGMSRRCP